MSFEEIIGTPGVAEDAASAVPPSVRRSPTRRRQPVVGGLPRVSLLPPEIRNANRTALIRRGLIVSVAAAVGAAAAGVLLAGAVAGAANDRLTTANDRTQSMAAQIAKFADVSRLDQQIAVGKAAALVGASTQIDWSAQYNDVVADMPSGYSVTSMAGDSALVTAPYDQGGSPLERPRVATIVLNVEAPNTTQLPIWLRRLRSIPAYADATASWTQGTGDASSAGAVTISLTVHLDKKALVNQKEAAQ